MEVSGQVNSGGSADASGVGCLKNELLHVVQPERLEEGSCCRQKGELKGKQVSFRGKAQESGMSQVGHVTGPDVVGVLG